MNSWDEYVARLRGHELADLRWHWDGAYAFAWDGTQFTATRTDNGEVITARTAAGLHEAVSADYAQHPVPRDLPD